MLRDILISGWYYRNVPSMGKIAKNTVWRSAFLLIRRSPYCQKYSPTDCFFGDFAHWVIITNSLPCKVISIFFTRISVIRSSVIFPFLNVAISDNKPSIYLIKKKTFTLGCQISVPSPSLLIRILFGYIQLQLTVSISRVSGKKYLELNF